MDFEGFRARHSNLDLLTIRLNPLATRNPFFQGATRWTVRFAQPAEAVSSKRCPQAAKKAPKRLRKGVKTYEFFGNAILQNVVKPLDSKEITTVFEVPQPD